MVGFVGTRARKRRRNRYLFIIFILAIFGIFFYLPSIDFTTEEKQPLDEIIPSNVIDESSLKKEIEEFLQCIENTHKPTTDINEAVNVQVVLDMIDKELRKKYG